MRKVGIALVIVVIVAVLSTPLVGGILARKAHDVLVENLDQIEASTLGTIRVTNEGFDLGWLSSKARMQVEIGSPGSSWSFPLVHVIHHGPLPVAHATRGFSMAIIDTTVDGTTLADGKLPFRGQTVIGMTGDLGVDLTSLALPRREDLAWEGGTAQVRVRDGGKRITVQASAPRLELHAAPGDVALESFAIDYTTERTPDGTSVGSATYALGRGRVTSQTQPNLSLDAFSWKSNTALNPEGKVDSTFALRLGRLDFADQSLRDAGFDLSLRNLDAAAAQALNEIGQELTQIAGSGQAPDQVFAQIQSALMRQVPRLLAGSAQVEVKGAQVETLDGRIDADVSVARDAAAADPGALQIQGRIVLPLQMFAALMQRAAGAASPAARQANDTQSLAIIADQIAEQVLTRGYVKEEEDGRLSSDISYRQNELVLNGRTLNLGDLILAAGGALQQ